MLLSVWPPKTPPLSIFNATGNSRAPSPVARLFDTDRFEAGNSGILSDPVLGITEFTNGNFLSRSTIFRDFALPRASDLVLEQPIDETDRRARRKVFLQATINGRNSDSLRHARAC